MIRLHTLVREDQSYIIDLNMIDTHLVATRVRT